MNLLPGTMSECAPCVCVWCWHIPGIFQISGDARWLSMILWYHFSGKHEHSVRECANVINDKLKMICWLLQIRMTLMWCHHSATHTVQTTFRFAFVLICEWVAFHVKRNMKSKINFNIFFPSNHPRLVVRSTKNAANTFPSIDWNNDSDGGACEVELWKIENVWVLIMTWNVSVSNIRAAIFHFHSFLNNSIAYCIRRAIGCSLCYYYYYFSVLCSTTIFNKRIRYASVLLWLWRAMKNEEERKREKRSRMERKAESWTKYARNRKKGTSNLCLQFLCCCLVPGHVCVY